LHRSGCCRIAFSDHDHALGLHVFRAMDFAVDRIDRFILKKAEFEGFLS
jgi:hypothetical protein